MTIEEFGKHLLDTDDLDPVYVTLHGLMQEGIWDVNKVSRWLVGYWCLYHCGAACYLSEREGEDFWTLLMAAARNDEKPPAGDRWPRGHERRHFRGEQGIKAVSELHQRYTRPEMMLEYIIGDKEPRAVKDVSERVRDHRGFGPWIGWKVCDMVDRVLGVPVSFKASEMFMFKDPVEAALRVWRMKAGLPDNARPNDPQKAIYNVSNYLVEHFKDRTAPPTHERPCNIQEIETILCKYKSHLNGHYPLLCDIHDITSGLASWAIVAPAAQQFADRMPKGDMQ